MNMSDSGVWGISQEYFDKVYPEQEKRRKMILSGCVKRPCKHGSVDEKDDLNRAIVQSDNSPPTTQLNLQLE